MAAGKIKLQKASGGVLNVTSADGATSTDLVLPLSGTVLATDSNGNLGIGVIPYNWNPTTHKVIDIGLYGGVSSSSAGAMRVTQNALLNSLSQWIYKNNGSALLYEQDVGHVWKNAPSGTNGSVITWSNAMTLDASGNLLLTSATGGLGYGIGSGGTVTQLTSKITAVTLNKPTGTITMNNATLAAGTATAFTLYNSTVGIYDQVVVSCNNGFYNVWTTPGSGACGIWIRNNSAGSLSDVVVLNYTVIKGVQS